MMPVLLLAAVLPATPPAPAHAPRAADSSIVRGRIERPDGTPVAGAVVLLLDTGDSTRTATTGAFRLVTRHRGMATVVARGIGFEPATADVVIPTDAPIVLVLRRQDPVLSPFRVVIPGEFTIGTATTATLTPLQVVETPGAAANVARAIQTLPGTAAVDEGTGLFVRGGDVTETRVLVDDAWVLSPARFDNPTGHVTATLNPFLLSRTVYSSGGFGAMYGNALSGLVRMETASGPARREGSLSASIGSLSAAFGAPLGSAAGARITAGLTSLAPLFATFGENQPFAPAPRGGDASGTLEWRTGAAGRVRLFAVRQRQEFGVGQADLVGTGGYAGDTREGMTVLSWRDSSSRWRPAITLGESAFERRETFGGFALTSRLVAQHAVAMLRWDGGMRVRAAIGAEAERLVARYAGGDAVGGAATGRDAFDARTRALRTAVMGEATWRPLDAVQVVAGLRSDRSDLTGVRTVDPRVSLALQRGTLGLTAAWGVYHQVAEPVFFRGDPGGFAPMRVEQAVAGMQLGSDSIGLRLEVYDKRWRALHQFTSTFGVSSGGTAGARGADLHLRWVWSATARSRLAWSVLRARRTDPATGIVAPATSDVTHSVAWITDRRFGALTVGTALRYATGRPYTDIVGATDTPTGRQPVFGAPNAERLPAYGRSDASVSWYRPLGGRRGLVLWGTLSNVFGRDNVMRYTWSADFRERRPVLAPFNRSLYAGATLLF